VNTRRDEGAAGLPPPPEKAEEPKLSWAVIASGFRSPWLQGLANISGVLGLLCTLAVPLLVGKVSWIYLMPVAYLVLLNVFLFMAVRWTDTARERDRSEAHRDIEQLRSEARQDVEQLRSRISELEPLTQHISALTPLRDAFRDLAQATAIIADPSAGSHSKLPFNQALRHSLAAFANSFSLSTGSPCRASIKTVGPSGHGGGGMVAVTLCRSSSDRRRPPIAGEDLIRDNTDFLGVFQNGLDPFFCNDLVDLLHQGLYRNSHWTMDVIQAGTFEYVAAIVWPIGGSTHDASTEKVDQVIAFLCVDSPRRGAFDESGHVPIGQAYASMLSLPIERLHRIDSQRGA
jgi:hypothetical protein